MYKPEYVKFLNIPSIPQEVVDNLPKDYSLYDRHAAVATFSRSDSFNDEIDFWCKQNISKDIDFGFQIINGDVPAHIDNRVFVKFFYLIQEGGDRVLTKFWSEDKKDILAEYHIPVNTWVLFRADVMHSVENVSSEIERISVVGKLF